MTDKDVEADKGRAMREYYEFMRDSFSPKASGPMDIDKFNVLRDRLEGYGIDPDSAAQFMVQREVQYQKGLAVWKGFFLIIVRAYFGIGSFLGGLLIFSYFTAIVPLILQNCRAGDIIMILVFSVWAAFAGSIMRALLWPYGLWLVFSGTANFWYWLMPGWFASCGV